MVAQAAAWAHTQGICAGFYSSGYHFNFSTLVSLCLPKLGIMLPAAA